MKKLILWEVQRVNAYEYLWMQGICKAKYLPLNYLSIQMKFDNLYFSLTGVPKHIPCKKIQLRSISKTSRLHSEYSLLCYDTWPTAGTMENNSNFEYSLYLKKKKKQTQHNILVSHSNKSYSRAKTQSLRFTLAWWLYIKMSKDMYLPGLMKKIWQILFKISGVFS